MAAMLPEVQRSLSSNVIALHHLASYCTHRTLPVFEPVRRNSPHFCAGDCGNLFRVGFNCRALAGAIVDLDWHLGDHAHNIFAQPKLERSRDRPHLVVRRAIACLPFPTSCETRDPHLLYAPQAPI